MELLRPGMTFEELGERSWKMHDIYVPNRYAEMIHRIGFGVEYPLIHYPEDHETWQYSGIFHEGATVWVENYIGPVALTNCPFEGSYM